MYVQVEEATPAAVTEGVGLGRVDTAAVSNQFLSVCVCAGRGGYSSSSYGGGGFGASRYSSGK